MTTSDLPEFPATDTPAPVPKKRGRPRKTPPPPSEEGLAPTAEGLAPAAPAAPKKRGRPKKNPAPPIEEGPAPTAPASSLVDTETATLDAYQREEPLPADDDASAPAGAPIETEETVNRPGDLSPEEEEAPAIRPGDSSPEAPAAEIWSPAVQAPNGEIYLPAESTAAPAPEGEEWRPAAEPRSGEPAPKPSNPAPDTAWEPAPQQPETGNRKPETKKGPVPYPADADPIALAASVQPSEALKAALAGQRLSRFEMRKLTRRERAYLRLVQHGTNIDYATFVARGIANAQQQNAKAATQAPQGGSQPQGVAGALPRPTQAQAPLPRPAPAPAPQLPPISVADLQKLDVKLLLKRADELGLADELPSLQKHDVVFELLRHYARRGGPVVAEGVLEIAKDGNGFLRNRYANYHTCPEDAQVPVQIIKRLALRPGDLVSGPCKPPQENAGKNRYFVLTSVDTVNGISPALARRITPFENQTPLFPDRRIVLETAPDGVEMRIVDLFTPIGFGQRGLIVAPPRTGKTVIMQKMANAITANYPDAYLIVLLIDERPEEVTDMERNTRAHVIASTFDEPAEKHVQVADLVIEMARRKVEMGEDVVILLDSITRLARAYNTLAPTNGRILSGGVEANALQKPKRFFGSARNLENGGSLTIIATALVETGSRMDEVIFEEFKGTGNMELVLDRAIADKRIFPAINIARSGTRKEDLLVKDPLELARVWFLRRAFSEADSIAATAMEELKTRLRKFPTNHDFLMGLQA